MDYSNIIIAVCTAIGTIASLMTMLNKRFDKIDIELKNLNSRVSRIEGYLEGRDVGSKEKKGA